MPDKRAWIWVSIIVVLLISLPYLYAFLQADQAAVFGGFLINPVDGHSYLAKMQIGSRGEWIFDLPYTPATGNGAYLFLFYIFLGHLARILELPNILIFHAARVASALLLIMSMRYFLERVFNDEGDRLRALVLGILGSGLGWIAAAAGYFTSDLWVAEAYPFLSAYTNPHFPLGLALMIFILSPGGKLKFWGYFIAGILLAVIQPFGLVIVVLVSFAVVLLDFIDAGNWSWRALSEAGLQSLIGLGLGGGIFLIYQYYAILTDPILSLWNKQNVTPSPALLDLLLSFSPCLIMAVVGGRRAWREANGKGLVIWGILSLLLLIVPWNLQRRFITGLFFPLAVLSIFGLKQLADKTGLRLKIGFAVLMILTLPTNLIVILSGVNAAATKHEKAFIASQVMDTMSWINAESEPGSLFLADQDLGLLIPSQTGRSVVYGHPFETVNAKDELQFLQAVYGGDQLPGYYREEIERRGIDYIVIRGDPATTLAEWIEMDELAEVFSADSITIFNAGAED